MIIYLAPFLRFLLPKRVSAITIWPFVFCRNKEIKQSEIIRNHEKIHLRQQIELLVIPFYLFYIIEYLYLFLKLKNHNEAYLNISFEKEAYQNDKNASYLSDRKWYAMWRH